MADYNIYIRNVGGGNQIVGGGNGVAQTSPTTPWQESAFGGQQDFAETASWVMSAGRTMASALKNPAQAVQGGAQRAGKDSVIVSVAAAVITLVAKTIDQGLTIYNDMHSQITGNYGSKVRYDNFKANFTAGIFNPVDTAINEWKAQLGFTIENQKRSQQRELLGDSIINSYSGRGI